MSKAKEIYDSFCRKLNARPAAGNYNHTITTPVGDMHTAYTSNHGIVCKFDNPRLAQRRGVYCSARGVRVFHEGIAPIDSVLAFQDAVLGLFPAGRAA